MDINFEHKWCGKCDLGKYSPAQIEDAVLNRNESFRDGYSYGFMAGILEGMDLKIIPMTEKEKQDRIERSINRRKEVENKCG